MQQSKRVFVLSFVGAVMIGMPCIAQEVEPPFKWVGKGVGSFISEYGTSEMAIEMELSVDEQGIIVMMINEYGDNPMLAVLNGRILMDKFLYGEVLLTQYETGSDTARALGVGDPEATLLYGEDLPSDLKAELKKCMPFGMAKIVGDYKDE